MIALQPLRALTFAEPHDGASDRLCAASGIAVVGDRLYVIADDELHLGVFDFAGGRDPGWVRLFPGALPERKKARKARKPDLEALVRLPAFAGHPSGALLALPSGSRPNRTVGALLALDATGALHGVPVAVAVAALYAPLQRRFPALNIEGAAVCGEDLVLLQRASGEHPENALIRFALAEVLAALSASAGAALPELRARIATADLGRVDGVVLGFTDAAALADGRLVFSAVAEHVDDTYHDGPCVGAAIGVVGLDGRVDRLDLVQPVNKIEGIHAREDGTSVHLLLVTDDDDRSRPGRLLSASFAL